MSNSRTHEIASEIRKASFSILSDYGFLGIEGSKIASEIEKIAMLYLTLLQYEAEKTKQVQEEKEIGEDRPGSFLTARS